MVARGPLLPDVSLKDVTLKTDAIHREFAPQCRHVNYWSGCRGGRANHALSGSRDGA